MGNEKVSIEKHKNTWRIRGNKAAGVTETWLNKLFNSACRFFFFQTMPKKATNPKHWYKKIYPIVRGNVLNSKDKILKIFIIFRTN